MQFRLGCAVWAFDGWVGDFYPPGTDASEYLDLYVERMNVVEGNTTFYAVPGERRVAGWAERMPDRFRFCPKLNRDITHDGRLSDKKRLAGEFIQPMKAFGRNLGPFHLQLPPSYGPEAFDDLAHFLEAWPRSKAPIAVELRHPAWFEAPHVGRVRALLEELGVARVLLDTRPVHESPDDPQIHSDRQKPELPMHPHRTAELTFVRYISHPSVERNDRYLEAWAERIDAWLADGTTVYFFVHCPQEQYSPGIARRFQSMLEERGADVPVLPWNELPPQPEQGRLL